MIMQCRFKVYCDGDFVAQYSDEVLDHDDANAINRIMRVARVKALAAAPGNSFRDFALKSQSSSELGRSCTGFSARPTESALCVTQCAIIQEPVQRQQHLVAILAAGLFQVTEVDQPIDKRFRQVEGNSMRSSLRRCDRYTRRSPAGTVVEAVAR